MGSFQRLFCSELLQRQYVLQTASGIAKLLPQNYTQHFNIQLPQLRTVWASLLHLNIANLLARCALRFQKSLREFIRVFTVSIKLDQLSVSIMVNEIKTLCRLLPCREKESWKLLKEATIGSASSRVSFSRQPVMDKMQSLTWVSEWVYKGWCSVIWEIIIFSKLKQKALDNGVPSVANVEFKGSHGCLACWSEGSFRA